MNRQSNIPWRSGITLAPLLFYCAASFYWFGNSHDWRGHFVCAGNDPIGFIWFLHWWPYALRHGLNPFISYFVWSPTGSNLTWDTSIPLAALVMTPFTWLGGPVLSFNILTLTAPAFAAWTAFLLARKLTNVWSASLIGGYLFGFSSYELGQMLGHLNLEMTCLVPLAPLICIMRVHGSLGRVKFVLLMAGLLLAQLGLSTEILATLCLFGALAWLIVIIFAPRPDRKALLPLAFEIPAAACLMLVLATPFLIFLFKGWPDVPSEINSPAFFSTDLLNFLVPTWVTAFGHSAFGPVSVRLTGNVSEQGAYIGLPLLFIVTFYFRGRLSEPYPRALLALVLVLPLLSLGPTLHVSGFAETLTLPWRLVMDLPLFGAALPCRIMMFASLAIALAAACWLAQAATWRWRVARFGLAILACFFLAPNRAAFGWSPWPAVPFFTPSHVAEALGKMPNVLILPFAAAGPEMAWQLDAGMGFTQAGGYVGFTPRPEAVWKVLHELRDNAPGRDFQNDLTAYCASHNVAFIIIGPNTAPSLVTAIASLGWQSHPDQGVEIIAVPRPDSLDYNYIKGDYWPSPAPMNWMGRSVTVVSKNQQTILHLSGKIRPMLTPVQITVQNQTGTKTYQVDHGANLDITLPPTSITSVTASEVFLPNQIWHNHDPRALSVTISVTRS